ARVIKCLLKTLYTVLRGQWGQSGGLGTPHGRGTPCKVGMQWARAHQDLLPRERKEGKVDGAVGRIRKIYGDASASAPASSEPAEGPRMVRSRSTLHTGPWTTLTHLLRVDGYRGR
ncbi:hypothetical protein FRC07_013408, partial [Ceratobasidium sp. 392]